jgi:RNA polymerase sigma factor (sigma-70 family)
VSPEPAAPPPAPTGRAAAEVEHFFRHEAGRLHGALTRLLGTQNLSLVEDVVQEALLRAFKTWSIGGFPENPSAWITRVAMNLARDAVRHQRMSFSKEENIITHIEQMTPTPSTPGASETQIRDDTLRMMFVCSHPEIPPDAQVVLALKILCGFSTGEIARAFLSSEAAIEKQLTRTKQRIKSAGIAFELPEGTELSSRLEGVLATLYLLFNEGYKASSGERLLREELCDEAIRLTTLLVEHPAGKTPRSHALLAFMLLTSARFPSRIDEQGELLRLDDQDRSKWDQGKIENGLMHLLNAAEGTHLSEYHLQAGIAACHCMAPDYAHTDWARILKLYDELYIQKPSPMVALNRAVVVAQLQGPRAALEVIEAIPNRDKIESHYLLHAVVGEFHWRLGQNDKAAESFRQALKFAKVGPEQVYLSRLLERASSATSGNN